jgi:hypothetical protein
LIANITCNGNRNFHQSAAGAFTSHVFTVHFSQQRTYLSRSCGESARSTNVFIGVAATRIVSLLFGVAVNGEYH